jgi:hypothetical protein
LTAEGLSACLRKVGRGEKTFAPLRLCALFFFLFILAKPACRQAGYFPNVEYPTPIEEGRSEEN